MKGRDKVGSSDGYPGRMVGSLEYHCKEICHQTKEEEAPWEACEFVSALIRDSSKI